MSREDEKMSGQFQNEIDEIKRVAAIERKKSEVLDKELTIRDRKADSTLDKIKEGDEAEEAAKHADYNMYSEQDILQTQRDNADYMASARNRMTFITPSFDHVVPFYRKNLVLIGGVAGEGKSTTVANIIHSLISQTNPETKKKRRVLVITNEEPREDVYNRVTCFIHGWKYVNHDQFSETQIDTFNTYIRELSREGILTVIDDNYQGARGTTTTIEGVCGIFDNLIKNKIHYDAVLIDYFQLISESRRNPGMKDWEVLGRLGDKLKAYKNFYPIVLMAQLTPDPDKNTPFKLRLEGRKAIINAATCVMEITPNREAMCTEWMIHKNRHNEGVGKGVVTGYDDGRYVEYTPEFIERVNKMISDRERRKLDQQVRLQEVTEDEQA